MDRKYEVFLGDKAVGTAQVLREGLYYRIRCHCNLSGDVLYRVLIRCDRAEENLGILVPKDGVFFVETRIPVKKIGEGEFSFSVVPRHKSLGEMFVPLCPEEPFRYLEKLKTAYLEKRNGQVGVIIKEPGCD